MIRVGASTTSYSVDIWTHTDYTSNYFKPDYTYHKTLPAGTNLSTKRFSVSLDKSVDRLKFWIDG
jgi:hypothetical protein